MILVDVNVLVYAFRRDSAGHSDYRKWLTSVVGGDEAFGVSDVVLSGFLRIVTHPKIFCPPTPIAQALAFGARILFPGALCESESGPPSLGNLSAPMPLDWCEGQPGFGCLPGRAGDGIRLRVDHHRW